jgi:hypothetical protein
MGYVNAWLTAGGIVLTMMLLLWLLSLVLQLEIVDIFWGKPSLPNDLSSGREGAPADG